MRTPSEVVAAFRARGLRVTPQRQLLFSLLDGGGGHPTAEALHARARREMPGISLRTVYTTLTDLAEMGEVTALTVDGGATRFDPNTTDHHHAVCDTCGEIGDVYVDGTETLVIDGLDGFAPTSTSMLFHGSCRGCSVSST